MQSATTIINPTVGRKVWYRASHFDQQGPKRMIAPGEAVGSTKRAPLDATIIAVHGERMVNLHVIDAHGQTFFKPSIELLQPGDKPHTDDEGNEVGGYAEWMPYQAQQAAAAEKKATAAQEQATQAATAGTNTPLDYSEMLLDFGNALDLLKAGEHLMRASWGNPKAFIRMIQQQIGVLMINGFPIQLAGQNQSLFLVDLETKSMKQWNPTQDDLFAEDWVITALAEVPVPTFHTEDPDHG